MALPGASKSPAQASSAEPSVASASERSRPKPAPAGDEGAKKQRKEPSPEKPQEKAPSEKSKGKKSDRSQIAVVVADVASEHTSLLQTDGAGEEDDMVVAVAPGDASGRGIENDSERERDPSWKSKRSHR